MLTLSSWRRYGAASALGLAITLLAPGWAEAQQGGLFPLRSIRRERVPCAAEDPVYKLYRHEYYGYHPTCWRRFPAGWGCPSPEAPNAAAAFRDFPRDKTDDTGADPDAPATDSDRPAADPGPRTAPTPPNPTDLPLPSGDTSPFDLDNAPKPNPATGPAPDATAPANPASPRRPATMSPRPTSSSNTLAPVTNPPAAAPARGPNTGNDPIPALPEPELPSPTAAGPRTGLLEPGSAAGVLPTTVANGPGVSETPGSHTPALAPRRQGLLTNLFGSRSLRRR